ncbi:uncharacterized protein BYT42DRAFT_565436 [Radiomyces spectabilis]|uniref:uncharacterized protein n=1 Tax=Radiomyces spectabilis TaxID=64574 RepID=UPI0022210603|nr:uncharacterized protein BYT42DRAFT_565436 [Radiomyces spectabilis]KAI8381145.1 hypothetical protein BYT42DRAFT_565436 [Radiomyces spectabilis]
MRIAGRLTTAGRSAWTCFLLLCCIFSASAQNFKYTNRFPQSKLYNMSPRSIGLQDMDGTIAAFADFNGDKFTDIFVLSTDQSSVTVYTWNHASFSFMPIPNAPHIQQHDFLITNIVPGDYNYDGKLDILIMGQDNPDRYPDGEIKLRIYMGNGNDTLNPEYKSLPSAKKALPMVLDVNGDMKTDLLGYAWNDGGNTPDLSMWINTADPTAANQTSIYNISSAAQIFDQAQTSKCIWSHPHSNAFLDLDGDCLADVVFICEGQSGQRQVQLWTNQREQGFKMAQQFDLPRGAGSISFADMDGDGSVDMIFPVCNNDKCQIHVVYNQQMGLCAKAEESEHGGRCRKAQNLCVADPEFKFDITQPNSQNYVVFEMFRVLDNDESIRMEDTAFRGTLPIVVQPGDYNLDGYPDLLVTTNKRVILLESILCTRTLCADEAIQASKRSFSLVRKGVSALTSIKNPRQAAFFDIDEDGSLDMLVLQPKGMSTSVSRTPHFVINNYFNDAFFLKGLVSNGVCPSYCPHEPVFADPKPYGVSYPGATFKFTVLDTSGVKRAHQVSQLSQTSYLCLQTPYSLFGLGRTNNYVEELFAGVTRHQKMNYLFYEGVIPNSQLVFIPYQPETVQDSSSWKVELYIQPAAYVPWVLVILIAAAAILGIVVAILHWSEKREDELERRKALHIINFDAL